MLKKILIGLAAVIAVILVAALFQPKSYTVSRSITIAAPPTKVFGFINNFENWPGWSPWEKLDPQMKRSFEGPKAGVGAAYGWTGNNQVGTGKMTITESKASSKVGIRLDFEKPMKDTCTTEFVLKPEGKGTQVTWSMAGERKYFAKVMCVFMSMEKMIGGNFETGLADMKSLAEAKPRK